MQQAKTANLGPAALSTTVAAPSANIWVLRQTWVLRRSESASWTRLQRQIWLRHLIRVRQFHWLPRLDRQIWLLRLDHQIWLHQCSQLRLQIRLMRLGLIGKFGTCGLLLVGKFDSVGKFGSVGNSLAIRLGRRLRRQIQLRWQFGSTSNPVCKFGSVGNLAAASAIWLRRQLHLQIRIRRQIRLRRQFIGNLAPSAAPSANSDWYLSAILLHRKFGSVGGSIGKFGSIGTLHREFGCIGNAVALANSYPPAP
jgi:hypothetical protein